MSIFGTHYFYRTIRKTISAFGTMFNDIQVARYNTAFTEELERFVVPIQYGPKEKWITRVLQDVDLTKSTQYYAPRMSFMLNGIAYDAQRKKITMNHLRATNTSNSSTAHHRYNEVPYIFDFSLSILTKTYADGDQILEQILPMFTPDYTLPINYDDVMGRIVDVPIILNAVSQTVDSEGNPDNPRLVIWDLNFIARGLIFSPITNKPIIKSANTNLRFDDPLYGKMTVSNTGFGNYVPGEYVYQGYSLDTASAKGYVKSWDSNNSTLYVENLISWNSQKTSFKLGLPIKGEASRANRTLIQIGSGNSDPAVIQTITPSPNTANIDSNYSYNVTYWRNNE